MKRFVIACLCILAIGASSCNHLPDHAAYIPKDAVIVAGINTKEIGKKIAWNAIIGSKLLEEMQKNKTGNPITDPAQIGIELMSTSYVYVKPDNRFFEKTRITALVPLEDAAKWEQFIKNTFPHITIKQQDKYKEARLAEGMFAGWSDKLLIVMNTMSSQGNVEPGDADSTDTVVAQVTPAPAPDDNTQLSAEMNKAFNITKDNSITVNKHFTSLETGGHDVTLWINYDELLSRYLGDDRNNSVGISLPGTLWKDAALAAGFDFEKGKIAGDIRYYVPDALKQVGESLGSKDADKEMIDRLPAQNLDMMMAWHLAPEGIKGLLQKTGVLGFVNLALTGEGLSADYILDAFTGDMVMSLNDLQIKKLAGVDTTGGSIAPDTSFNGDMHYTYALKINKKENFNKLLQLATEDAGLQRSGNGTYTLNNGFAPLTLMVEGNYCVVTNHPENGQGYLQGKFKTDPRPAGSQVIYGNPFGIYFNARGVMNALDPHISSSLRDSAMLAESRELLQDITFKGGSFRSSAFEYHMAVNFINKDENSLLQLMDFTMRMNKASEEALTAQN